MPDPLRGAPTRMARSTGGASEMVGREIGEISMMSEGDKRQGLANRVQGAADTPWELYVLGHARVEVRHTLNTLPRSPRSVQRGHLTATIVPSGERAHRRADGEIAKNAILYRARVEQLPPGLADAGPREGERKPDHQRVLFADGKD